MQPWKPTQAGAHSSLFRILTRRSAGWVALSLLFSTVLGHLTAGCSSPPIEEVTPSSTEVPNKPPTGTITSPANGAVIEQGATVSLAGRISDPDDPSTELIASWSSSLDGELSSGPGSADGKIVYSTSALSLGTHTIALKVTDPLGASSSSTIALTIRGENTAPTATLTAPQAGALLPAGEPVNVTGVVSDAEDVPTALTVVFRSSVDGVLGSPKPDAQGTVAVSAVLSTGAHELTLEVEDSSGKSARSAPVKVSVGSNEPPQVLFTGPENTQVLEGQAVTLSALVLDDVTDPDALVLSWSASLAGAVASCPTRADAEGVVACTLVGMPPGDHEFSLTATDGSSQSDTASLLIHVNGKPEGLVIRLEPAQPKTDSELRAVVEQEATDPNGDVVSYRYEWYRNGVLVASLTTSTVPSTATERDDLWRVKVFPSDGIEEGDFSEASVTILNTAPVLTSVSLSPPTGYNDTVFFCLPQDYYDADGDHENYRFVWLVNGTAVAGVTTSSYMPSSSAPGASLSCQATPTDGTDLGSVVSSGSVVLGNRLPSLEAAVITPSTGNETTTFRCEGQGWSDADQDPQGWRTQWYVNGLAGLTSSTLTGASFKKHDEVTCRLIPYDGHGEGTPVFSTAVEIANAVPTVSSAAILPSPAYVNSSLRCQTQGYSDADGDSEQATFEWKINGEVLASASSSALVGSFVRGDKVDCAATVTDGEAAAQIVVAPSITIVNAPPSISSVSVSPSAGSASTSFTANPRGYEDADGDPAQYRYQWYINEVANVTTKSISPGAYKTGDKLRVEVTPFDGVDAGQTRGSAIINIGSAANPPEVGEVVLTPSAPREADTLTCTALDVLDPEGDPWTLTFQWVKNGANLSASSGSANTATLTGASFAHGDVIECVVTPKDASLTGAAVSSNKVTIQNTPPVLARVTLSPSTPTRATGVTCQVQESDKSDVDGDAVTVSFAWLVNGTSVSATGSTLSGSSFHAGDSVVCKATPSDGLDEGTPVLSSAVTIQNSPPVVNSVLLSPAQPREADTLDCAAQGVSDADGDTVSLSYSWYVGTQSIAGAHASTLTGVSFKKGDSITCKVTPSANSQTGSVVTSNAVTILNTEPTLQGLTLTPALPVETDTLVCAPQSLVDADGDTLTQVFTWAVNSQTVAGVTGSTLTGSSFKRGDQVRCSLVATDTSGAQVSATSASVTIQNSPPVLASVRLTPDPAYVTSTFQCTPGTATDADGDRIAFLYAWLVNGTKVAGATTATFSSTTLARGNTVVCQVTPLDDVSSGATVNSNAVTIANQAPVVSSVDLSPTLAYETSVFTCTANGVSDPDSDPTTLKYAWYVNSSLLSGQTTRTLNGTWFDKGNTVQCEVTANDGATDGAPRKSNLVTVENSLPTQQSVTLTSSSSDGKAYEGSTLTCAGIGVADVDPADSPSSKYAWKVNGTVVAGATSSTLTGASFNKTEVVTCSSTPTDGLADGTAMSSAGLTVQNTVPETTVPVVGPAGAKAADTLTCTATASDVDPADNEFLKYAWTLNGTTVTGATSSTLTPAVGKFKGTDTLTCTTTPNDGAVDGLARTSSSFVISNTAPTQVAPVLTWTPTSPSPVEASTLICTAGVATDPDQTTGLSPVYAWKKNGTVISGKTTSSLGGTDFNKGDELWCEVTVTDLAGATSTVASNHATAANTAPVATTPTISPPSARVGETLTCNATSSDVDPADTPSLKYAWLKGGTAISNATFMTLVLTQGQYKGGDSITCRVTPTDGVIDGTATTSAALVISNTPPTMASATMTWAPTSVAPVEASTLTCTAGAVTDPDQTAGFTYTYRWLKGGTAISGQATTTLTGTSFNKGDELWCEVTVTDSASATAVSTSNHATAVNTAPTTTTPVVGPTGAQAATTLTCTATPSDVDPADASALTLRYAWSVNSTPVAGATSSSLIPAVGLYKGGDRVTCTVTPNDGVTDGTSATSAAFTITNTSPTQASPSISWTPASASPVEASTLTCTAGAVTDPDQSSGFTFTYRWLKSTVAISGQTTSSLTGTSFNKGDVLTCEVTVTDSASGTGVSTSAPVTVANTAPSVSTPVVGPTGAKAATTLTCSATPSDVDPADASSLTVSYVWTVNGTTVSGATSSSLTPAVGHYKGGDSVTCAATPSDGTASGAAQTSASFTITNTSPTQVAPTLTWTPTSASPVEASTLTCTAGAVTDPDQSSGFVTTYRWLTTSGAIAGQTGTTLTGASFNKGNELWCEVTVTDSASGSSVATSNHATVGNTAPTVSTPVVGPAGASAKTTLTCTATGADVDPADASSVTLTYAWTVNGTTVAGVTGSTLAPNQGHFKNGNEVTCAATPNDGTDAGTPVVSAIFVVSNSSPTMVAPTVSWTPTSSAPVEASTLTCTPGAVTDPDQTAGFSYSYRWLSSGVALSGATSATLTGTSFNKGDVLTCEVTVADSAGATAVASSASVTVGNTAPVAETPTLAPLTAKAGDTITCTASSSDVDPADTVTLSYVWSKNTIEISGATGSTLTPAVGQYKGGDVLRCTVTPQDGTTSGTAVTSAGLTIQNTAPLVAAPVVTPSSPTKTSTLTCTAGAIVDPDQTSGFSRAYAWYNVSGVIAGQTTATLTSSHFNKGDELWCQVTETDSAGASASALSNHVTVLNTAPTVAAPTLTPASPLEASTLACAAGAVTDPDQSSGFVRSYKWYSSAGVIAGQTGASLTGASFSKGDEVWCEVTEADDENAKGSATSNHVTIGNSAPTLTDAVLSPTSPTVASTLTCTPSGYDDVDGDPAFYTYQWYMDGGLLDGEVEMTLDLTLIVQPVEPGSELECEVVASDGTAETGAVRSNRVTVVNTAPTLASVAITPASPRVDSTLTCTPSGYSDLEGTGPVYAYRWFINGGAIADTTAALAGVFVKGDAVRCEVTPGDGALTGEAVLSAAVTIGNTAPTAPSLTFVPTAPEKGQSFVVSSVSTDLDGDSLTYAYLWKKNGVTQSSYTTDTIPAGVTHTNEVWAVTVTPHDGTTTGTASTASVTIMPLAGTDLDVDGYTTEEGDCDDTDSTIYPGAAEILDSKDNDCAGGVDDRWSARYVYGGGTETLPTAGSYTALAGSPDTDLSLVFGASTTGPAAYGNLVVNYSGVTESFSTPTTLSTVQSTVMRGIMRVHGGQSYLRTVQYEPGATSLRFFYHDGTTFQSTAAVTAIDLKDMDGLTIATRASDGADYMLYVRSSGACTGNTYQTSVDLRTRTAAATTWSGATQVTSVGTCAASFGVLSPSMVFADADGSLHISMYRASTTNYLEYRRYTAGTDGTLTQTFSGRKGVDTTPNTGRVNMMVIEPGTNPARPHIFYLDAATTSIKEATTTDFTSWATWTSSTLLSPAALGGSVPSELPIIARYDSANALHMIFAAQSGTELWYATNRSGSWVAERVDAPTSALNVHGLVRYDLQVDSSGNPWILFPDPDTQEVILWKGKLRVQN